MGGVAARANGQTNTHPLSHQKQGDQAGGVGSTERQQEGSAALDRGFKGAQEDRVARVRARAANTPRLVWCACLAGGWLGGGVAARRQR